MTAAQGTQESEALLNPALDRQALARQFARKGRIQVHDLFAESFADALYDVFEKHIPWSIVFRENKENIEISPREAEAIPAAQHAQRMRAVTLSARDDFQFIYNSFMILNSYQKNEYPGHPLYYLLEYINGAEFLDFIRDISGIREVFKADAQATLYRPGHFLTRHDDLGKEDEGLRLAYVMSFTRDWKVDWGGLLQFFGEHGDMEADGDVAETFVPRFNSLTLFKVPVKHSVSMVTPFAGGGRYGVTGWFRDK